MSLALQLKFLGLTLVVLVEIAANVAYVNHLVRFKSGLENNDTLRRLWSKPEQVIFQPVKLPIVLSWIVGLGVNSLVRSIMIGFLQVIDALRIAGELSLAGDFAVTVSGTAAGTIAATLLYIIDGGTKLPYQVLGTLILFLGLSLPPVVLRAPASMTAIWVIAVTAIVVSISIWIKTRGVMARVPTSSVRELRSDAPQIYTQRSHKALVAATVVAGILMLIAVQVTYQVIALYIGRNHYEDIYLAQVLRNFAGLMILIACSLYSIMLANLGIILRDFGCWQWVSTSPALIMFFIDLVVPIFLRAPELGRNDNSLAIYILHIAKRVFMYAAAGFLGSAVYLAVLARAASKALDPGVEGQSELIVDDEDSEYEIEP